MKLAFRSIFVHKFQVICFTCRKILRHGADGFTFPSKEDVLQISIILKNPSPRPGLNPRTLGPMASTLTITPPKRLRGNINTICVSYHCISVHKLLSSESSFCRHRIVFSGALSMWFLSHCSPLKLLVVVSLSREVYVAKRSHRRRDILPFVHVIFTRLQ
jgi:hypothetical protein